MTDPRTDKQARRERLRTLDPALAGELLDAGSQTIRELHAELHSGRLLPIRPTKETLEEWWEYTRRRGVIDVDTAGNARVTEYGRGELDRRQREWAGVSLLETLRRAVGWLAPSGAVIVAAVALGRSDADAMIVLLTIATLLVCAAPLFWIGDRLVRTLDGPIRRRVDKVAVLWLDGAEVRAPFRKLPVQKPQRLY